MKKYLISLSLLLIISTNVFAEITDTIQTNQAVSNKYFAEAKDAYNKKDLSNTLKFLKKSAKYNNAKANFMLGMAYYAPLPWLPITKPNTDLAMEYMSQAAQLGNDDAKKMLILFQLKGFGNIPAEKIIKLRSELEMRVLNSNVNKAENLLNLVDSYLGVKQKELRSVNKAEYFADQLLGLKLNKIQKIILSASCVMISIDYMWGYDGAQKDPHKSFKWMKTAADLGEKEAYYNLSDMYYYGYGTSVDIKKSNEMTKLGDKLDWSQFDTSHKKHMYPIFFRPIVYSEDLMNKYDSQSKKNK